MVKSINNDEELKQFLEIIKNNYNKKINFLVIGPIPNFRNKYLNPLTCLIQKLECKINKTMDYNGRNLKNIIDQMTVLAQTKRNIYFFGPRIIVRSLILIFLCDSTLLHFLLTQKWMF